MSLIKKNPVIVRHGSLLTEVTEKKQTGDLLVQITVSSASKEWDSIQIQSKNNTANGAFCYIMSSN